METQIDESTLFVTDLQNYEYVVVRSDTFDCECGAYVVRLGPHYVEVRLELPDDHPSVQEALAENPHLGSDNIELYDIVAPEQLSRPDGRPIRFSTRPVSDRERAARAKARGFSRVPFPELDNGLRR